MRRRSFVYKCEGLVPPKKRQWSSGNSRGNAVRGKEGRGQCNQMAQNLQKLHKHTLPERTHAAHAATAATATATCNARENLCQGAAKPCRQRRVAECRVWTLAYCVRVQLRRLSQQQQQQQDEGSRSSLERGGGTGGDSANSFYCCSCPLLSAAAAATPRLLLHPFSACFCSSPALILAMALRFCRVRFAALTVHQCGPGGQLAAMVLRLPQTPVPSPASSPASLLLPLLLLRAVYLFAHPSTLPHPHLQLLLLLLQLQSASGGIIVSAASAGLCLHSNFVWISSTSAAAAAFAAVAATVACHPRTSRHVKPFFIARAWCGLNAACMSMRRVYMCECVCVCAAPFAAPPNSGFVSFYCARHFCIFEASSLIAFVRRVS